MLVGGRLIYIAALLWQNDEYYTSLCNNETVYVLGDTSFQTYTIYIMCTYMY